MVLAAVCCKTFNHRRLLVYVADNTVDNVVNAIGNTKLQRRNVHQLRSLAKIHAESLLLTHKLQMQTSRISGQFQCKLKETVEECMTEFNVSTVNDVIDA